MSLYCKDFTILFIGSIGLVLDPVFYLTYGATLFRARSINP